METTNYNWDTMFDTSANLMYHTFKNDRVMVVCDFNQGQVKLLINKKLENTIPLEGMTPEEYVNYLLKIAKES